MKAETFDLAGLVSFTQSYIALHILKLSQCLKEAFGSNCLCAGWLELESSIKMHQVLTKPWYVTVQFDQAHALIGQRALGSAEALLNGTQSCSLAFAGSSRSRIGPSHV